MSNQAKVTVVSDTTVSEMQRIVRSAAEPAVPGESVKAALGRAARRLGLGYRRARTFWYGDACSVRAWEADRLRTLQLRLIEERLQRLDHERAMLRAQLETGRAHGAVDQGCPATDVAGDRAVLHTDQRTLGTGGSVVRTEGVRQ